MDVPSISTVEQLLGILAGGYRRRDELGPDAEAVDQLTHALQSAHEVYLARPADEELQVAALVHDIGHLMFEPEDHWYGREHAEIGAAAIAELLGSRVAQLVALHVDAKRYLAATDASYAEVLSPASRRSLMAQGGAFDAAGIRAFEKRPHSLDAVVLRQADDRAKEPGRSVPSLLSWRPVVETVVLAARRERVVEPAAAS